MPHFIETECAGGGKSSGEEGLVPPASHGLEWLEATSIQRNLAERDVENRAALRDRR